MNEEEQGGSSKRKDQ